MRWGGGDQAGCRQVLWPAVLGGDMDGGPQESRQSLAGQTRALVSSWVKEAVRQGERSLTAAC